MKEFLLMRQWGWQSSGVMLSLTFIIAIALVKPIGVSSQYAVLNDLLWNSFQPELIVKDEESNNGYSSSNTNLNQNDISHSNTLANSSNYGLVFIISMVFGGLFGRNLQKHKTWSRKKKQINNINAQHPRRYALAFIGGFLVLFGAGLAGGCTSGHMLSGMMQTALSGYLFTFSAFAAGIPAACLLYRNRSLDD